MAALGVGPGDEVVLPSFTFSSVANCVLRQRAKPVFADNSVGILNALAPRRVSPTPQCDPQTAASQGCFEV